ncbi:MTH1187 family thiamine-binding protein [bacterium]|nr:MTH1187 family thiamine-binding protein [bacterium]MCB2201543.1 MTH1187 family thiamine-binding protein [bacterium]
MIVNLTMFPTSKGTDSASADVAKVIDIIDKSGLPYKLGPMSTSIEGEWEKIMPVVNKARKMLRRKYSRVYIVMTIDDRKGARNRLTGKIRSVETRLGREVNK